MKRKNKKRLARAFYKLDRERILQKQNYRCYYCKRLLTKKTATMDHVIPRSHTSGYHTSSNCVVACFECNNKKGSKLAYKPEVSYEQQLIKDAIDRLEERIKKAEYNLSFDRKGGYRKWKQYWQKRNRWKH